MITDCVYCGLLELDDLAFFADTLALLAVAVPGIIGVILWRILITNKVGPRGGITVLGLDESLSIYSERRLSRYVRGKYVLAAVPTFALGLMVSEVFALIARYVHFW